MPKAKKSGGTPKVRKDFWKENCDDPDFAFEQYVQLYHFCFKPATSPVPFHGSSSFFHRQCIRECRERLIAQHITNISAGASQDKVDDILELGLRAVTGTHLKFDEATGVALFKKVAQGNFPKEKKAIAASLICQCLTRMLAGDSSQFDPQAAFTWADKSCEFGAFNRCSLNLVLSYDRLNDHHNLGAYSKFKHLWAAYEGFREETGRQRPYSKSCSNCNENFARRTILKQCSGHCPTDSKPIYCNKDCQKAHWPKHRQWCKVETVESDSDWTTDSELEIWEHSEGEGPPSPPDIPEEYEVHVSINP